MGNLMLKEGDNTGILFQCAKGDYSKCKKKLGSEGLLEGNQNFSFITL